MRPRIGVIVQARMGSHRLPGKVLRQVAGKPLLAYLLERLRRCEAAAELVVATSRQEEDQPVARFCEEGGVACFRGDLDDVASRFVAISQDRGLDAFVRLSGDSPLLDTALVEERVGCFRAGGFDLATNVFPRTFPTGQSVEVVRCEAYRRAYARISEAADREHVTSFLYRHPDEYAITNLAAPEDLTGVRLTVDTPEDLERFAALVGRMERPHWQYGLAEVVGLYRQMAPNPEVVR
ncbi:MAG: NTP transferase domain-containing protein [Candidatus Handelsmanbacteria bacterium]|nr:NTP transferase domain-containing protein [Candidatus Handelsmanbacteria bacterium]